MSGDRAGQLQPGDPEHDPAADPRFPRVTAPAPSDAFAEFPPGWGAEPTERDRAVIEAKGAG